MFSENSENTFLIVASCNFRKPQLAHWPREELLQRSPFALPVFAKTEARQSEGICHGGQAYFFSCARDFFGGGHLASSRRGATS